MFKFCTLFDKNYLFKGLALYNSLLKNCDSFKLWILCFDDITYDLLKRMNLRNIELISLKEFEDEELLRIKNTRSPVEYYWTCTPSLPLYILKKEQSLDMVTYLDADLFFYSSPLPIYKEFGDNSILIVKHNYSTLYEKYQKTSGEYNVQFLIFRNDYNAIECLRWWREMCIEWCYFKHENGKLGDQKYLDDWLERFKKVHILKHSGGGVAPWNVQKYSMRRVNNKVFIDDQELIFYHFHQLNILSPTKFDLSKGYIIPENVIEFIYKPYIYEINKVIEFVYKYYPSFKYGYDIRYIPRASSIKGIIKNIILRNKILTNFMRKYVGKYIGKTYYLYEIKK